VLDCLCLVLDSRFMTSVSGCGCQSLCLVLLRFVKGLKNKPVQMALDVTVAIKMSLTFHTYILTREWRLHINRQCL